MATHKDDRITKAEADRAIRAARKHVAGIQESSARFALADAIRRFDLEEYSAAWMHAVDSLRYSVGIFHEAFIRIAEGV